MDFSFTDLDKNIFLILNGIHNEFFDIVMSLLSNLLIWIPLSLYLFYVLIKNFNLKSTKNRLLTGFLLLLLAYVQYEICVNIAPAYIEGIVQRVRPCYDTRVSMLIHYTAEECGSKFGFFASRACLAFSVATFLYLALYEKHKAIKISFIVLAFFISYSRIYLGVHYPANVLVSALAGVVIGFISYPVFFYIKNLTLSSLNTPQA